MKASFEEGHKFLRLDRGDDSWLLDMKETKELLEFFAANSLLNPVTFIMIMGGAEYLRARAKEYKDMAKVLEEELEDEQ